MNEKRFTDRVYLAVPAPPRFYKYPVLLMFPFILFTSTQLQELMV